MLRPTPENAERAFQALRSAGVPLEGLDAGDLLIDYDNIRYGPPEDHVDLLNSLPGLNFDDVWRNREEVTIAGVIVPIISKRDLITNKQEVGGCAIWPTSRSCSEAARQSLISER